MANAVQGATCGYEWQEPINVNYKRHDVGKDRWGQRMPSRTLFMSKHPTFSPFLASLASWRFNSWRFPTLAFLASWRFNSWRLNPEPAHG